MKLAEMRCTAIRADTPKATRAEIAEMKPQIPDWRISEREGEPRLEREFKFRNFAEAMAFSVKVGDAAEAEDHHPALLTEWGKVTVSWWTHAIRGLHRNDFIMAARTDQIYDGQRVPNP